MAQWLRCCATNRKVAGSIPTGVIGNFHWPKILPFALWSWGRLSLYQKCVPGPFPGGKGCWCLRLTTLPPSCEVVMKSGNLNTFTAIVDLSRFNNSGLKSPAATLVDLIFQSRSFSLNQLTWRETCTAASVYLADVIFILFIAYYAYVAI